MWERQTPEWISSRSGARVLLFPPFGCGRARFPGCGVSLTDGNSPHALDCLSQIRVDTSGCGRDERRTSQRRHRRAHLHGTPVKAGREVEPQSRSGFQHLHAGFTCAHVNLDCGLWSVTSPPTRPDPSRSSILARQENASALIWTSLTCTFTAARSKICCWRGCSMTSHVREGNPARPHRSSERFKERSPRSTRDNRVSINASGAADTARRR